MVYPSPKAYGKRLRKYNHNKKKIDQAFKTHTKEDEQSNFVTHH